MPKILIVVTSHAEIDSEHRTGLWLEEFAVPYAAFREAGIEVVTASPRGGAAPVDPRSRDGAADAAAVAALERTLVLHEVGDALQYDAIFVPGGHGAMFDLANSLPLKTLLSEFDAQGKLVAAVCHGPAAFVDAIRAGEPSTLVAGRTLTCFTDEEERIGGLQSLMPYLLASKLREQGATVIEATPWESHVEIDGTWITGQNPQSSAQVARAVLTALRARVSP
ncbi:MAG: type 1 glutamine amidotransferase domain-containing protein [Candidatus Eremiobacteraeota bacterium]|nr:type 1 glutamine amidotransferase domain-containing protein [Candidatus Eremiobacteraeota bacterium]